VTVLARGLFVLPRNFKARALGVVKANVFFEIHCGMTIRTRLLVKDGSELGNVDILMAVDTKLLFNRLEFINRLLPGPMTVLA